MSYGGDCFKSSGETFSHTCDRDDGEVDTCTTGNTFAGAIEVKEVPDGYTQCQVVPGGEIASFLLADGSDCSGGPAYVNTGGDHGCVAWCGPRDEYTPSCTGNGIGKECVWRVPVPECDLHTIAMPVPGDGF